MYRSWRRGDHLCMSAKAATLGARRVFASGPTPIPPHTFFVGSAVFHYLGPSFAVLLFVRVPPLGVAWLRIVSAGVVFALWRRPWRALRHVDRSTLVLVVELGAVLAVMNSCFYLAIDRLPLATVSAIEFLPVIGLAAIGVRRVRNALALALAAVGVYLLTQVELGGRPLGLAVRIRQRGAVRALHRAGSSDRAARRPPAAARRTGSGDAGGLGGDPSRRWLGASRTISIWSQSPPGSASASAHR